MIKSKHKGKEGYVTTYAFRFLHRSWLFAISETKWHSGDKYKRAPIWFSNMGGNIPTMFIWKLAIGYGKKKEREK